jgi:uncharacterized protein YegL
MYNPAPKPQELSFTFLMPDTALITKLIMTSDGKNYEAILKDTVEAQRLFQKSSINNNSAIILNVIYESRNRVNLTATAQGFAKISFDLTYEEYLPQRNDKFIQTIKMVSDVVVRKLTGSFIIDVFSTRGKIIENFTVIDEFEAEKLNVNFTEGPLGKRIKVDIISTTQRQFKLMHDDGRIYETFNLCYKLNGTQMDDIIISNEYFIYFFPSETLSAFPKYIVFIIDVSGSMSGLKLQQTKDAMINMLDSLTPEDYFNIISFAEKIYHWKEVKTQATTKMKKLAIQYVRDLKDLSTTDINAALIEGIQIVMKTKSSLKPRTKMFIFFMTDGEPTSGETDTLAIIRNVKNLNRYLKVPIHCLAFGKDANDQLLKDISEQNLGKSIR